MKKLVFLEFIAGAFSVFFAGCTLNKPAENPDNPLRSAVAYVALAEAEVDADTLGVSENRNVGLLVDLAPDGKSGVVRLDPGEDVSAGARLVLRGIDFSLRAVAEVEVVERATVGIVILSGRTDVGDSAVLPGARLKAIADKMVEKTIQKTEAAR